MNTSPERTRAKLIALLCVLGAFRVSAATLPLFNDVTINDSSSPRKLVVPVSGYKNDLYGDGLTVPIFECSEAALCPVRTFQRWSEQTAHIHERTRNCRIVFELQRPFNRLQPDRCAEILKGVAREADLDTAAFTAKTFRKSGIMAGIRAGVEPDALFRLGGWRDPNTFWRHYVVRQVPSSYSDILFNVDSDRDDANSDADL